MVQLMRSEWLEMIAREGTVGEITLSAPLDGASSGPTDANPDAEPPCPACGTAAPLVDGECSGCGLFLGG